jgi:hypothetical protein
MPFTSEFAHHFNEIAWDEAARKTHKDTDNFLVTVGA